MACFLRLASSLTLLAFFIACGDSYKKPNYTKYTAQVRVVVDRAGIQQWRMNSGNSRDLDLKTEIKSMLVEVSDIFKSLEKYKLKINFVEEQISFHNRNFVTSSYNRQVSARVLSKQFRGQLSGHKHFDLALLLTGFNLYNGKDSSATSYSGKGTVCSTAGVAVVELTGTYTDALTVAKEFGHMLGASYRKKNDRFCKGFVMNIDYDNLSPKMYQFSQCAYMGMEKRLRGRGCLKDGGNRPVVSGPRFGSLVTADDLCTRHFGRKSESFMSRRKYTSYGKDVCIRLPCMTSREMKDVPTAPGLKCGVNKHCIGGQCVNVDNGKPTLPDSCPFDDQPILGVRRTPYTKCSELPSSYCDKPKFKKICCGTCDTTDLHSADAFCRKKGGPHWSLNRMSYSSYTSQLCSKMHCLYNVRGRLFRSHAYKTPNGLACGKNKRCMNGHCIVTKDGNSHISDRCPFGDQPWLGGKFQMTCPQIVKIAGCRVFKDHCCQTCAPRTNN